MTRKLAAVLAAITLTGVAITSVLVGDGSRSTGEISEVMQSDEIVASADMDEMQRCGGGVDDTTGVSRCLVDMAMHIGNRTGGTVQSWQQALDTLEAYVISIELFHSHQLAHEFFLASRLDVDTMRALDFDRRDIGFVHGWMAWYLSKTENYGKEKQVYDFLCAAKKNLQDLTEDCAHGFGHVAYEQDLGEFTDRIDFCDRIGAFVVYDKEAEIGQCYAGLLMSHGPPGEDLTKTGNARPGEPLRRITQEEAGRLCREASLEAAKRCWPWVSWYYYSDPAATDMYVQACDAAGAASPWCGQGVARYLFFVLRDQDGDLHKTTMDACLAIETTPGARRGTKLGCAVEVVREDLVNWRREGKLSYREFPCSKVLDPEGLCTEAVQNVAAITCELDQDVEWMDVCIRNREAGRTRSSISK